MLILYVELFWHAIVHYNVIPTVVNALLANHYIRQQVYVDLDIT